MKALLYRHQRRKSNTNFVWLKCEKKLVRQPGSDRSLHRIVTFAVHCSHLEAYIHRSKNVLFQCSIVWGWDLDSLGVNFNISQDTCMVDPSTHEAKRNHTKHARCQQYHGHFEKKADNEQQAKWFGWTHLALFVGTTIKSIIFYSSFLPGTADTCQIVINIMYIYI